MTDASAVNESVPGFPLRWRGYDCDEVDRFIRTLSVDRRRLDEAFARLDALIASKQDGRVDEIVANAHRQADEIRATAEQEARRILRNAESQGEYLQCERLKASRREIERLESVRKDVEACLETALVALARARGSAIVGTGDMSAIMPAAPPAEDTTQAQTAREEATRARPSLIRTALIVVWAGLSVAIVVLLATPLSSQRATERVTETASVAPVTQPVEPPAQATLPLPRSASTASIATAEISRLRVTVTATRECWISVVVDDGEPQERLLKPSEQLVVDAADAVVLKAGNAAAVSVLINDQQAVPLGVEGQVVTRRITRANFRTLLAPDLSRG